MKRRELYYHIGGWTVYILYIVIGFIIQPKHRNTVILNYTFTFVKILQFYFLYLWVYPKYLNKQHKWYLLAGILLSMAGFIVMRFLLEEVGVFYLLHFHNYSEDTTVSQYILENIYYSLSAVTLSIAIYSSFEALRKEHENKSLREEKVQAELAFLKSQINPHFLYNTLNYIYSMAYPVSDELANAIIKLSNLMRYMLNESKDGKIALDKEVDYMNNYIDIYRMRFEGNFNVLFTTEGDIEGKRVASLLLIPFVENAFKHGVVNDVQRPVKIQLKVTGNRLSFTVSNKINRNQKDTSSGIGLVNIRRRLELIYANLHELLIADNGQTYKTTLYINL